MLYQISARAPNTYWNYIFIFKFEQFSYLFSLKNSRTSRDLNWGPPRYQADMLPIELSLLGSIEYNVFPLNQLILGDVYFQFALAWGTGVLMTTKFAYIDRVPYFSLLTKNIF